MSIKPSIVRLISNAKYVIKYVNLRMRSRTDLNKLRDMDVEANSVSAKRKVFYVVSIWHEIGQESTLCWQGDLETAAGQHLNFTSLAELNHLLCELGGWIDPPTESTAFLPSND